tara:strand:- start:530 stop:1069 length:540 start_codon:yes stop_codon:yes gene_type:complete
MVIMGVVALSALDLSSYCHPSEEGDRAFTAIKAAGMIPDIRIATSGVGEAEDYAELTWRVLEDVDFKDVYIEELDAYYWKPKFGDTVNGLEGKEVHITGYMIPVDLDEDFYVLSRYPFANCFFCGGAGPESVIDLRFEGKSPRVYQTDERLTFAGKFRLNADDVYQMNYILDGAFEHTP